MSMLRVAVVSGCALVAASVGVAGESLRFVERAEHETVLHRGSAADALGDLIIFANPLYDAANRKAAGTSRGSCIRVETGKSWECTFTLALPEGSLEISGSYADEGDSDLAVTGGTGHHAGARGTLRVHPRDAAHDSYDFDVNLMTRGSR
jgi:allene oxide cyclase